LKSEHEPKKRVLDEVLPFVAPVRRQKDRFFHLHCLYIYIHLNEAVLLGTKILYVYIYIYIYIYIYMYIYIYIYIYMYVSYIYNLLDMHVDAHVVCHIVDSFGNESVCAILRSNASSES